MTQNRQPMIELERLLLIDDECLVENAIADCLGDRFLVSRNKIFGRVRNLFCDSGFSFAPISDPDVSDYAVVPLLFLPAILRRRTVPYRPNVPAVKRLVKAAPGFRVAPEILLSVIGRNVVLHEAAHCISWELVHNNADVGRSLDADDREVLRHIMCEAYANAIERVAGAAYLTGTHHLLFALNAFIDYNQERLWPINQLLHVMGIGPTLLLAIWIYFLLNLHGGALTNGTKADILSHINVQDNSLRMNSLVALVIDRAFGLNKEFILNITPTFFQATGLERSYNNILQKAFTVDRLVDLGVASVFQRFTQMTVDGLGDIP